MNEAQRAIGTWQCCDECAKIWVKETENGWGICPWGTASRTGQKAILEHNLLFDLKHNLINR